MKSVGIRELRNNLSRCVRRVEGGVEPVRTLDALQLATLEMVADPPQLTIITRDKRIRANAKALGYVLAGSG